MRTQAQMHRTCARWSLLNVMKIQGKTETVYQLQVLNIPGFLFSLENVKYIQLMKKECSRMLSAVVSQVDSQPTF